MNKRDVRRIVKESIKGNVLELSLSWADPLQEMIERYGGVSPYAKGIESDVKTASEKEGNV